MKCSTLQTNTIDFADKEGEVVKKSQKYVDVICGSPQRRDEDGSLARKTDSLHAQLFTTTPL